MKHFNNGSCFLTLLRSRVDEELNHKPTGNYKLFIKTAIIAIAATGLYFLPYFVTLGVSAYVSIAILRGFVMGLVGFNIGHDALHGSYSSSEKINKLAGYSFDASGIGSWFWHEKHNILHHTHTNTQEDTDIDPHGAMKFAPWQKWHPIYRFQFIYAFFLYGFLHIEWFVNDIKRYFKNQQEPNQKKRMNKKESWIFWIFKGLYVTKSLILPIILLGFWQGLISFLVMEFTCGLVISLVFQLAHVQNKSMFLHTSNEWAEHQIQTTADFATGNPIISWLLGGLNYQTMHHLLPKVSHIHYPRIRDTFIKTCEEFSMNYNRYPTMFQAIVDHISYLYKIGKKPKLFAV